MNKEIIGKYWEKLLDNVKDGLVVVNPEGKILMVNEAMARLAGYSAKRLAHSPCTILNCDACELVLNRKGGKWCMLFEAGRVNNKRCHFMRKDGSLVSALKNASVLKDEEGNLIGAVETFTDISEVDRRDKKIELLSRRLEENRGFHGMVGKSALMRRVYEIIERASQSDAPVIIYGESGTGKELAAQAIHEMGMRREGPFIQFNCAALNEALMESELFGHVKGAFTGAYRHRMGRFEAAHGGDIFLDEIGDIPMSIQAKLLRVLETKRFERVGDYRPITVDARIISATNRDLSHLVSGGRFRKDLFFRINVIPIHLPPLRARKEDIALLIEAFIHRLKDKTGKNIMGVSPAVMDLFMERDWPGNIRELRSVLEYAFVIAESGMIDVEHLPAPHTLDEAKVPPTDSRETPSARSGPPSEKEALIEALRAAGGRKTEAAKILGIHRMTVWNRMKKYGIESEQVIRG